MVGQVIGVSDIEPEAIEMKADEDDALVSGIVHVYNEIVSIIDLEMILIEKEEVS